MSDKLIFCPLYSGSSGNSILISYKDTTIIVDAGVSFKKLARHSKKLGLIKKLMQFYFLMTTLTMLNVQVFTLENLMFPL